MVGIFRNREGKISQKRSPSLQPKDLRPMQKKRSGA